MLAFTFDRPPAQLLSELEPQKDGIYLISSDGKRWKSCQFLEGRFSCPNVIYWAVMVLPIVEGL